MIKLLCNCWPENESSCAVVDLLQGRSLVFPRLLSIHAFEQKDRCTRSFILLLKSSTATPALHSLLTPATEVTLCNSNGSGSSTTVASLWKDRRSGFLRASGSALCLGRVLVGSGCSSAVWTGLTRGLSDENGGLLLSFPEVSLLPSDVCSAPTWSISGPPCPSLTPCATPVAAASSSARSPLTVPDNRCKD
jgi:hypothetical protein